MADIALDPASFPHIFDSIFRATPRSTRLKLRSVCRALRDHVDAHIANHVTLIVAADDVSGGTSCRVRLAQYTSVPEASKKDQPCLAYQSYDGHKVVVGDDLGAPESRAFLRRAKAIDIAWNAPWQTALVAAIQQHISPVHTLRLFPGQGLSHSSDGDESHLRFLFQHLKPASVCVYLDPLTINPLTALQQELKTLPKPKVVYSLPELPYSAMMPAKYSLPLVAPSCSEAVIIFREPWLCRVNSSTQCLDIEEHLPDLVGCLCTIAAAFWADLPSRPLTIVSAAEVQSDQQPNASSQICHDQSQCDAPTLQEDIKTRFIAELGRRPDPQSFTWTEEEHARATANLTLLTRSEYSDMVGHNAYDLERCAPL